MEPLGWRPFSTLFWEPFITGGAARRQQEVRRGDGIFLWWEAAEVARRVTGGTPIRSQAKARLCSEALRGLAVSRGVQGVSTREA